MRVLPTFGRYLRRRFGFAVRKIPLSIPAFTCPNIDGKYGRGGCSYCVNESFSPNLIKSSETIDLDRRLTALRTQYRATAQTFRALGFKGFLAYFQSFSNTYAPIETLRALHDCALSQKDCIGVSVGTRADCIDEATLSYLSDLNKRTHLWVEIGAQSSHNQTLKAINRRENFETVAQTIAKLKSRDIRVCAHLIFGLPNETDEMIFQTIDRVAALNIDAIKIHPLYIVQNAAITKSDIEPLSLERYLDLLINAIKRLPENIIYQRISAGVDNETLIAPKWCKNKNYAMSAIRKRLSQDGFIY
ncbi:MAG: TIGR01212 family radical SAM protein [Helicobacteraceae bacterium]|jgi:radical SAM protein (TIGR01212 family)|nr:TIGR01212 family radical SAM protein [Helicobacteraceae bacterium]